MRENTPDPFVLEKLIGKDRSNKTIKKQLNKKIAEVILAAPDRTLRRTLAAPEADSPKSWSLLTIAR